MILFLRLTFSFFEGWGRVSSLMQSEQKGEGGGQGGSSNDSTFA